jgi:hypothetical protein
MTYRILLAKSFLSQVRLNKHACVKCAHHKVGGNAGVGKETVKVRFRGIVRPGLSSLRTHRISATPGARREGLSRGAQRPKGERCNRRVEERDGETGHFPAARSL